MATLTDLADYMDQLAIKAVQFGNEVKKDVASTILSDVVQVTPIDVGEALSNWQVTLDAPAIDEVPAFVPSPKGRVVKGVWEHKVDPQITHQANVPPTMDAGLTTIRSAQPSQPVFITNNSDHIALLDQGSSTQTPAGFVDRAVVLGEQVVSNARLKP